jgi:glycosyltransferase involved in cell wall biosynthesis
MSKDQPLVSVIIPCYNQAEYVIECLESIKAQIYPHWECIIMDDGSADQTKYLVQNYIKNDSRFTYNYQSNTGVSGARNNAVKLSTGKYILPIDGDDKIGNTYIEKAVAHLENNLQTAVVYCKAALFGNSSGNWPLPTYSFELLLKENTLFCSGIYRRADFDKTLGYDTSMKVGLEDWDFWISLLSLGGNVYQINETLFYYRIRQHSRNSSFDVNKEREIRNYVYQKHKALYDKHFNLSDLIHEIHLLSKDNNSLINSRDYKIGKKILSFYRFFRDGKNKKKP